MVCMFFSLSFELCGILMEKILNQTFRFTRNDSFYGFWFFHEYNDGESLLREKRRRPCFVYFFENSPSEVSFGGVC